MATMLKPSRQRQTSADQMFRHAFYNTTQALLYGDPGDEATRQARALLRDAGIAIAYLSDTQTQQPILRAGDDIFIDLAGIQEFIDSRDEECPL